MKSTRVAAHVLLLVILMTGWACGKKGPPRLTVKEFPARVTNLKEEWINSYLYLKGDIIGLEGEKGARGCRVYYGRYNFNEAPCDDCPVEFNGFYEFGPDVVSENEFSCVIPGHLKAGVYYFKVYLMGDGGAVGPPSNVLKATVK